MPKTYSRAVIDSDRYPLVPKVRIDTTKLRGTAPKQRWTQELNKVLMNIREDNFQNTAIDNKWFLMSTKIPKKVKKDVLTKKRT